MLKRLLISWLVNFVGLWVASELFSGIQYGDRLRVLIVAALVFALINAIIRPVITILSLPFIVVTLGFFTLVINTFMLYITSFFYPKLQVNSIWSAVGAVVIVWLVNYVTNWYLFEREKEK